MQTARGSNPILFGGSMETDPSKIKKGKIRHESLPDELLKKIATIYRICGRYTCPTLEEFEVGFMYDLDPAREVSVWSRISLASVKYHQIYLGGMYQSDETEKTITCLLCVISTGAKKRDCQTKFQRKIFDNLKKCYLDPLMEDQE